MNDFIKRSIDKNGLVVIYYDGAGKMVPDANGNVYRNDFELNSIEYRVAHGKTNQFFDLAGNPAGEIENWQAWLLPSAGGYSDYVDKDKLRHAPPSYATFEVYFNNDKYGFDRASIKNWKATNDVLSNLNNSTASGKGNLKSSLSTKYIRGIPIYAMDILVVGYHSPGQVYFYGERFIMQTNFSI